MFSNQSCGQCNCYRAVGKDGIQGECRERPPRLQFIVIPAKPLPKGILHGAGKSMSEDMEIKKVTGYPIVTGADVGCRQFEPMEGEVIIGDGEEGEKLGPQILLDEESG